MTGTFPGRAGGAGSRAERHRSSSPAARPLRPPPPRLGGAGEPRGPGPPRTQGPPQAPGRPAGLQPPRPPSAGGRQRRGRAGGCGAATGGARERGRGRLPLAAAPRSAESRRGAGRAPGAARPLRLRPPAGRGPRAGVGGAWRALPPARPGPSPPRGSPPSWRGVCGACAGRSGGNRSRLPPPSWRGAAPRRLPPALYPERPPPSRWYAPEVRAVSRPAPSAWRGGSGRGIGGAGRRQRRARVSARRHHGPGNPWRRVIRGPARTPGGADWLRRGRRLPRANGSPAGSRSPGQWAGSVRVVRMTGADWPLPRRRGADWRAGVMAAGKGRRRELIGGCYDSETGERELIGECREGGRELIGGHNDGGEGGRELIGGHHGGRAAAWSRRGCPHACAAR